MTTSRTSTLDNLKIQSRKMEGEFLKMAIDKEYCPSKDDIQRLIAISISLMRCVSYVHKLKEEK